MTTAMWSKVTKEFAAMDAGVSIATTGDKASYIVGQPYNVVRWGIIATVSVTGSPVIKLDRRPTAGSDTGRVAGAVVAGVDTAGGTLTPGALTAGKVAYHNVIVPATGPGLGATGGFQINPGEELVWTVSTAAVAGTVKFFVELEEVPFVGDANVGSAANNSSSNRIFNATKFAS